MTVFGGPAALAAAVTGACRVHENKKRNVAFINLSVGSDGLRSVDACAETHRKKHLFEKSSVGVTKNIHRKIIINAVALFNRFFHSGKVLFRKSVA